MLKKNVLTVFLIAFIVMAPTVQAAPGKLRIFVVSSYHRDYLWSQQTQQGFCAALKDFKFLETDQQIEDFTKNDVLETDTVVLKKAWMDTKRKSGKGDIAAATENVMNQIKAFAPSLVVLGSDNATNFVGSSLIDTGTPVVFWGVTATPRKYGYIDSVDHPGHNITGVYKAGYYKESLLNLKKLVPAVKTFAILSDDSETARAKIKVLEKNAEDGNLPLRLVDTVVADSFADWKARALAIQGKVDAFYLTNFASLKNDDGSTVDVMKAGAWYLTHIKKPEAVGEKQLVQVGMLVAADESGYKQGYEAGRMVDLILHGKKNPAEIAVVAPSRGAIMVNKLRAQALGIDLTGKDFIEETVEGSKALEKYPQQ
ncbi:MAG: hypothetical protein HQL22_12005 [Candidatus Omnitrophica bacterium]|nr:hypothetical protein [Candidatus Omnitrophota bacterium]